MKRASIVSCGLCVLCGAVLSLLGACGTAPAEHFYALTAEAPGLRTAAGAAANASSDISVAVGPVTLPEIVDRPQLVVQLGGNRVAILEQQRWAEPLEQEIPRVVALNLAQQLGTAKVFTDPRAGGADAAFRVALDVQRFESILGEAVNIEVLWTVRKSAGGAPVAGRSVAKEPMAASGYDAIVAAHSRALAAVSREIAAAIRTSAASGR